MEYAVKTLQQAIVHFADRENCRKFMVFMRWPDGVARCPYCDSSKVTWLAKDGRYRCYGNHKPQKFSLKVGTVFEDSPIGLDKWLPAAWLICNAKNGISSYEIARSLGVTQKTAWFMMHRIRLAMVSESFLKMGGEDSGPVEVDEAYIGGKPGNKHLSVRKRGSGKKYLLDELGFRESLNPDYVPTAGRATKKIPVFGMLDRETRKVRTQIIPEVKREVLMDAILNNIVKGSTIYSDGLRDYVSLKALDFVHETVNHVDRIRSRGSPYQWN